MSAARQIQIIYELRASDAPADGPPARRLTGSDTAAGDGSGTAAGEGVAPGDGGTPETPAVWWDRTTSDLRERLAVLGFGARSDFAPRPARLHVAGESAGFVAEVAAGVVSEAVRLTMSWIGRSPLRAATLTGPRGQVLRLAGQPHEDELNLITQWLTTTTGTFPRPAPGTAADPGADRERHKNPGPTEEPWLEQLAPPEEPGSDGRTGCEPRSR